MNYTLRKLNCKAFIIAIFSIVFMVLFSTRAYAAYSMRLCPNFLFDNKAVYVAENVSPRASSLTSVTVGYDNLSDLVYYCNEHGLSTTLAYNTALGVYVGYVNDDVIDVKTFGISSLHGLVGNSAGKVYVAKKEASGGDTVNNNTYNFNQTIINNHTVGSGGTVSNPYVSSSWTDRTVQEKIYQSVDTIRQMVSITNGYLSNLGWINIDIRNTIQQNVVPAIEAVNKNLISFKDSTVAGLNNLHTDLTFAGNVLQRQLDVENRIYSGVAGLGSRLDTLVTNSTGTNSRLDKLVTNGTGLATRLDTLITNSAGIGSRLDTLITSSTGIDSRLDSIINNGAVQVNTSSIDARLDKLISMYSKVNSVVLDTASLSGSRINDAVGGELRDVMFWGQSRYADIYTFDYADPLTYTLNGVQEPVIDRPLRGMVLGASIPSSINTSDDVIQAGIWKRSDGKYIISDTYNAATGEYVQRVRSTAYDGTEKWGMVEKTDGVNLFYHKDNAFENVNANNYCQSSWQEFKYREYAKGFKGSANEASAYKNKFTVLNTSVRFVVDATTFPTLESWTSYLSRMASLGYPLTVWFIPSIDPELGLDYSDGPTVNMLDRTTVTVPEGNSTISSACVRITGKYETYDSYTQTADIIAAINNIPPYDDSGLIAAITGMDKPTTDLTEVTSRLDLILAELQSSSGSATCEHTYAQHMEQEADCTLPGLMISTCSQCGDSYSEIVDPLGHDWVVSSHVDAVTDPDTGEETASAYDVYTCSRCERTYEDHTGDGAPDEDYSSTSISKLVVQVFSKLGTFAGKLIGFFVHLLDKALTSVDNVISKFNDYTAQISGFGGSYTTWLTGFWGIIPVQLQVALTFSVICMALGAVGKKLLFS